MRTSVKLLIVCATVLGLAQTPAYADADAIKYRQSIYKAIGAQMSAMGSILKGEVPHRDDLTSLSDGIASLSVITPDIFPEGSDKGSTDALPEIWEQPEEFAEMMREFQEAAKALSRQDPAQGMRRFAGAFQRLGRTCKGCHDRFKAE